MFISLHIMSARESVLSSSVWYTVGVYLIGALDGIQQYFTYEGHQHCLRRKLGNLLGEPTPIRRLLEDLTGGEDTSMSLKWTHSDYLFENAPHCYCCFGEQNRTWVQAGMIDYGKGNGYLWDAGGRYYCPCWRMGGDSCVRLILAWLYEIYRLQIIVKEEMIFVIEE